MAKRSFLYNPIKIEVNSIHEDNADMFISNIPSIEGLVFKRFFIIDTDRNTVRGKHAHKKCWQLLFNIEGEIDLKYINQEKSGELILRKGGEGFLFPPMNWLEINMHAHSRLLVLASDLYEESDYIRDFKDFENRIFG